jgi:hypothetical protein
MRTRTGGAHSVTRDPCDESASQAGFWTERYGAPNPFEPADEWGRPARVVGGGPPDAAGMNRGWCGVYATRALAERSIRSLTCWYT